MVASTVATSSAEGAPSGGRATPSPSGDGGARPRPLPGAPRIGELSLGGVRALFHLDELLGLAGQPLLAGAEDLLEVWLARRRLPWRRRSRSRDEPWRPRTPRRGASCSARIRSSSCSVADAASRAAAQLLLGGLGLRGQLHAARELRLDLGARRCKLARERFALARGIAAAGSRLLRERVGSPRARAGAFRSRCVSARAPRSPWPPARCATTRRALAASISSRAACSCARSARAPRSRRRDRSSSSSPPPRPRRPGS